MNNALIKDYIDSNPLKVVKKLDLGAMKLEYDKIVQCQKEQRQNLKNWLEPICLRSSQMN